MLGGWVSSGKCLHRYGRGDLGLTVRHHIKARPLPDYELLTRLAQLAKRLPTSSHIPIRLLYVGIGGMSYQRSGLSFDTIDRPVCPFCGEQAYLTRRSPHPDHDFRYELQIFTCSACDHTIERIVDANGSPPEKLNCCD
jgi:hypothetical protein